jgi:hypothetical protein
MTSSPEFTGFLSQAHAPQDHRGAQLIVRLPHVHNPADGVKLRHAMWPAALH